MVLLGFRQERDRNGKDGAEKGEGGGQQGHSRDSITYFRVGSRLHKGSSTPFKGSHHLGHTGEWEGKKYVIK